MEIFMKDWINKNKLIFLLVAVACVAIVLCIYFSKYKTYGNSFDEISFLQRVAVIIYELPPLIQYILFLPLSFIIPVTIMLLIEKYAPNIYNIAQYGGCLIQVVIYLLSIILVSSAAKEAIRLMTNIYY